jgi:hypothetical protein
LVGSGAAAVGAAGTLVGSGVGPQAASIVATMAKITNIENTARLPDISHSPPLSFARDFEI